MDRIRERLRKLIGTLRRGPPGPPRSIEFIRYSAAKEEEAEEEETE